MPLVASSTNTVDLAAARPVIVIPDRQSAHTHRRDVHGDTVADRLDATNPEQASRERPAHTTQRSAQLAWTRVSDPILEQLPTSIAVSAREPTCGRFNASLLSLRPNQKSFQQPILNRTPR